MTKNSRVRQALSILYWGHNSEVLFSLLCLSEASGPEITEYSGETRTSIHRALHKLEEGNFLKYQEELINGKWTIKYRPTFSPFAKLYNLKKKDIKILDELLDMELPKKIYLFGPFVRAFPALYFDKIMDGLEERTLDGYANAIPDVVPEPYREWRARPGVDEMIRRIRKDMARQVLRKWKI